MAGPVAGMEAVAPFREALIILATAGVVVPFLQRFRLSPVLGFLIVGIVVGPSGLGGLFADVPVLSSLTVRKSDDISLIAEMGVVFLLFVIGLELSLERLYTLRRLVFGLGLAQVVVSGAVIFLLLRLMDVPAGAAAAIGAALALSSTAIVAEVLSRRRRMGTPAGRATFAVLLLQDLAVVPILILIGVLGARGQASVGATLLIALAQSALALAFIVAVGRLVLRPLFRLVALANSPELFMAATLLVVIGSSVATAAAGLSMALGAFLAGLLLAETEYRREIMVTIAPFKGLLLGVFFMSVGMGVDLAVVAGEPVAVIGGAIALIFIKAVLMFGLARAFRVPMAASAETALLIGPGGEFAFVIIGVAVALEVVPSPLAATVLAAVSLSMAMIPPLARLGQWGRRACAERTCRPRPASPRARAAKAARSSSASAAWANWSATCSTPRGSPTSPPT